MNVEAKDVFLTLRSNFFFPELGVGMHFQTQMAGNCFLIKMATPIIYNLCIMRSLTPFVHNNSNSIMTIIMKRKLINMTLYSLVPRLLRRRRVLSPPLEPGNKARHRSLRVAIAKNS